MIYRQKYSLTHSLGVCAWMDRTAPQEEVAPWTVDLSGHVPDPAAFGPCVNPVARDSGFIKYTESSSSSSIASFSFTTSQVTEKRHDSSHNAFQVVIVVWCWFAYAGCECLRCDVYGPEQRDAEKAIENQMTGKEAATTTTATATLLALATGASTLSATVAPVPPAVVATVAAPPPPPSVATFAGTATVVHLPPPAPLAAVAGAPRGLASPTALGETQKVAAVKPAEVLDPPPAHAVVPDTVNKAPLPPLENAGRSPATEDDGCVRRVCVCPRELHLCCPRGVLSHHRHWLHAEAPSLQPTCSSSC